MWTTIHLFFFLNLAHFQFLIFIFLNFHLPQNVISITVSTDDANQKHQLHEMQKGGPASGLYADADCFGDDESSETEDRDRWNSSDNSDISEFYSSSESDQYSDLDISE